MAMHTEAGVIVDIMLDTVEVVIEITVAGTEAAAIEAIVNKF